MGRSLSLSLLIFLAFTAASLSRLSTARSDRDWWKSQGPAYEPRSPSTSSAFLRLPASQARALILLIDAIKKTDQFSSNSRNGHWKPWLSWGPCSVSCGWGMRKRHRRCSPSPQSNCQGASVDAEKCALNECRVKSSRRPLLEWRGRSIAASPQGEYGLWGSWLPWSGCSASCGEEGVEERRRVCNLGSCGSAEGALDSRFCRRASPCRPPTSKGWSAWASWSGCSSSCGPGFKERQRFCYDDEGDESCLGSAGQRMPCHLPSCPRRQPALWGAKVHRLRDLGKCWGLWESWSSCQHHSLVDGGIRLRQRDCLCSQSRCQPSDSVAVSTCPIRHTITYDHVYLGNLF